MRWVTVVACAATVLTATGAMGQTPSISSGTGTFASGSTFVLQGSGFGDKADAAPYKFDTFESGSVGNQLSGWSFDTGGGSRNPEYSNSYVRPNSSKSAVCIYEGGQYLSTFGVYKPSGGLSTVYMDFWVLFDRPASVSRNHKLYRLYPGLNGGLPNQYLVSACPEVSANAWFTNDGVSGEWNDTRSYPGWAQNNAQRNWVHMQVYLEQSDASVTNGTLKAWFDCGNKINRSDYMSRSTTNSSDWHSLWFGNYLGHGTDGTCLNTSGDNYIYFDDVYIDVTQARVEAGNSSSYDNCTHREIQAPTSWNNTQVNVTVNTGSFNPGEQVWFFIVNENGAISSGRGPYVVDGTVIEVPGQPGQPELIN